MNTTAMTQCHNNIVLEDDNIKNMNYFGDGKFEFVEDMNTRRMLINCHAAITSCELWNWIRNFNKENDEKVCFMFPGSKEGNIYKIYDKMKEHDEYIFGNHSGCSLAMVMREMEIISKKGHLYYKQWFLQLINQRTRE